MLRKYCLVASVALLGLLGSPASANQGSGAELSPSAGDSNNLSATETFPPTARSNKSALVAQPDNAESAIAGQGDNVHSKPISIEYPALALLAVAVISMAALSRRDALTFDDNKR
jgi:hypothetical protein